MNHSAKKKLARKLLSREERERHVPIFSGENRGERRAARMKLSASQK